MVVPDEPHFSSICQSSNFLYVLIYNLMSICINRLYLMQTTLSSYPAPRPITWIMFTIIIGSSRPKRLTRDSSRSRDLVSYLWYEINEIPRLRSGWLTFIYVSASIHFFRGNPCSISILNLDKNIPPVQDPHHPQPKCNIDQCIDQRGVYRWCNTGEFLSDRLQVLQEYEWPVWSLGRKVLKQAFFRRSLSRFHREAAHYGGIWERWE